jgi:sigma-54 dependent transcriptional regulator, acetoin dehydrogenase operon transcriptional activator AcoR
MVSAVTREWERFVAGGVIDTHVVRSAVAESWQRCRRANLRSDIRAAPAVLTVAELENRKLRNPAYRASRDIMLLARECLPDDDTSVMLIDHDCHLLHIRGSSKIIAACEEAGGVLGSRWKESDTGTDALSLCLRLDSAVYISRHEHYCQIGHPWLGAAAPIHAPTDRRLLGAISMYANGQVEAARIQSLVIHFASLLENELLLQSNSRQLFRLEMLDKYRIRYPQDTIFSVTESGEIEGELHDWVLPADCIPNLRTQAERAIVFGQGTGELTGTVRNRKGSLLAGRFFPVVRNQEFMGFVAILPKPQPRSFHSQTRVSYSASYYFKDLLGFSPVLERCIMEAERYASSDLPVLISGESGTGKELFAHAIHNASPRRSGPFVAINCGGVTDELISAELFGYTDGAFTGAARGGKIGKLDLARGGSLFLDEIETMSPFMQAALLRIIEESFFHRIGDLEQRPLDVRFIAATNVDLLSKVRAGSFRLDVYHRLATLTLSLPPLRERRTDIPGLVQHFMQGCAKDLTEEALLKLEAYCWPGNIRQLRNVLHRATLRSFGEQITVDDLRDDLSDRNCITSDDSCCLTSNSPILPERIDCLGDSNNTDGEKERIVRLLASCNWNVSAAARKLGLHRVTLSRKLRRLEVRRTYSSIGRRL